MLSLMPAVSRLFRLLWLALVPAAVVLEHWFPDQQLLIFGVSCAAVVPLARLIGDATSDLAAKIGEGLGGLLNATFGNAAELIIGAFALRRGLTDLVKASLTGSIIANVLLVFGVAAIAGGIRRPIVKFNRTAAGLGTTMLLLSAIGLVVPATFHLLSRSGPAGVELQLDTEIAGVLLATYFFYLFFALKTHRDLYTATAEAGHAQGPAWPAVVKLMLATGAVAVVSETLVGSVEVAARAMGTTELFAGVVVVALVGNAAEHYSAVSLAWHGKMDAALQIAVGSSTQIALFVAPALVFLSYAIGHTPMDLLFTVFEVTAVTLAVLIISFIAHDGETHWMEGVQLVAVYVILALGFFFLPSR
jgi:Ca2+:H+ antiporter